MTIADFDRTEASAPLRCDVCIVGAGAAGITLALELARADLEVLILEAGGLRWSGHSQALYRGEVNDPLRHLPPDQARYRQLGGTTSLWGGRCVPFDPIDFEVRDWVAYSGWPFSQAVLEPYYRRAHIYCECGPFMYDVAAALGGSCIDLIEGFQDDGVLTSTLERWSPPTHFGKAYRRALVQNAHIRVLLHAVATSIEPSPASTRVQRIHVASLRGRRATVEARAYVIAGGGLESTRLLLHSDTLYQGGIGAHSGWLGRGYMCHIHGVVARVRFRPYTRVVYGYERDLSGVYCRRQLRLSDHAQRAHRLLNAYLLLDRPLIADPSHGDAVLSLAFLLKRFAHRYTSEGVGSGKYALYYAHLRNVLAGSPQALSVLPKFLRQRFLDGRGIPSMLQRSRSNEYHLYYQSEQPPRSESRLTLNGDTDELGMRRLRIDFRLGDAEVESVFRAHELIAHALARSGYGEVTFHRSSDPRADIAESKAVLGHHIGTTRMTANPRDGVVDANCRLHSMDNLFIASSSVFPTSSHANPTLTIVALAIRIADYLVKHVTRLAPFGP